MKKRYRVREERHRNWDGERHILDIKIDGKRRQLRCNSEEEAHQKAQELLAKEKTGSAIILDHESVTIDELIDAFIAAKKPELQRGTVADYESIADNFVRSRFGSWKATRLRKAHLLRWKTDLLEAGHSPSHVNRILSYTSIFLEFGVDCELLERNVAKTVKRPKKSRRKPVIPSKFEILTMLDAAAENGLRAHAMFALMIYAGLRLSEVRGIRITDVDHKNNIVRVRQRADRWGTLGFLKSDAGERNVDVPAEASAALREWIVARPAVKNCDLLFCTKGGKAISPSNFRRDTWRPVMKAAKLLDDQKKPVYAPHQLRHAAISLWIALRLNIKKIQEMAGHSDTHITLNTYAHLFSDDEDHVARIATMKGILQQ